MDIIMLFIVVPASSVTTGFVPYIMAALATMPVSFLPELGGYAFGTVLSVILEFAKLIGISEDYAAPITVVAAALWTAAVVSSGYWPVFGSWVVAGITIVLTLASVVLGSKATYIAAVKPISKKRWNKVKD